MPETAIVDASALIVLEKLNLLHILCKLYSQIILPEAVINEFGTPTIDCYSVRKIERSMVKLLVGDSNLGKGEAEAIALAYETGMKMVIDDLKARKVAATLDLSFTGTIGILLKAERLSLIDSAYNKTKELRDKGFHVSDQLLDNISRFKIS